jgi:hypothetical protein
MIDAPGEHHISGCTFLAGISDQYGGNLYVGNADSIRISDSTFVLGSAFWGGGGVALDNTPTVIIENSFFTRNQGVGGGGGVLVAYTTLPTEILQATFIIGTRFEANQAQFGGGFMASGLGSLPNLIVLESTFEDNTVDGGGAAGFVTEPAIVLIDFNRGLGNLDASGECDDFLVAMTNGFSCIDVDETYII